MVLDSILRAWSFITNMKVGQLEETLSQMDSQTSLYHGTETIERMALLECGFVLWYSWLMNHNVMTLFKELCLLTIGSEGVLKEVVTNIKNKLVITDFGYFIKCAASPFSSSKHLSQYLQWQFAWFQCTTWWATLCILWYICCDVVVFCGVYWGPKKLTMIYGVNTHNIIEVPFCDTKGHKL